MTSLFVGRLADFVARPIQRRYDRKHPGRIARNFIRLGGALFSRGTPNDKWNIHLFIPKWFSAAKSSRSQPPFGAKRVLLFTTYRIQISHDLALAALLAWRGHSVTIAYLPKLQSPIKGKLTDHPSAAGYLQAALAKVEPASGGKVRCVDLRSYVDPSCPIDSDILRRQAIADLVIRIQRESFDVEDPEIRSEIGYYEDLGRLAQQAAWGFLSRHAGDFDVCLIASGSTFEPAHWFAVAKSFELTVNTYEKFSFRNIRFLNHDSDFRSLADLDTIWSFRNALGYLEPEFATFACTRAMELLNQRRQASTQNWTWALQKAPSQTTSEALAAAGVEKDQPYTLVCTNVPFDVGWDQLVRVFPSMREWLVATVRHLLQETQLQIVVRAHPGEAESYGGHERSEQNLAKAGLLNHPRLTMITADDKVNTYGLMEKCRFGAVFSSTAGLEMAMLGRPVAVGSDVYYARRGYTHDPKDADDYLRILSDLAAAATGLTAAQQRDAQLFHFILHFVAQWPYPYDKPSGIRDLPPQALVRSTGVECYLPALDALTLSAEQWKENLQGFLRPGCAHVPAPAREATA